MHVERKRERERERERERMAQTPDTYHICMHTHTYKCACMYIERERVCVGGEHTDLIALSLFNGQLANILKTQCSSNQTL